MLTLEIAHFIRETWLLGLAVLVLVAALSRDRGGSPCG